MTRSLPEALAARLATGATTLARAWTIRRRDGVALGFTDHDRPLTVAGTLHEPAAGAEAEALESAAGLGLDSQTLRAALTSEAISARDLARGAFEGAEVIFRLVDWREPAVHAVIARGRIGEVRRGEHAFEAEVEGLSSALNRPQGRAYLRTCDRRLGDRGCGVDLTDPAYRGQGTVAAVAAPGRFTVSGLDAVAARLLERGTLTWTGGANAGTAHPVKRHRSVAGGVEIALWQAPAQPVAEGDAFAVTAGCDKTMATCRDRFANLTAFGGFPHMPGDDWAVTYPNTGDAHDGGSLFRP